MGAFGFALVPSLALSLPLTLQSLPSFAGTRGTKATSVRCQERGAFQGLAGWSWRGVIGCFERFPGSSQTREASGRRGAGHSEEVQTWLFLRRMSLGWPGKGGPTPLSSSFPLSFPMIYGQKRSGSPSIFLDLFARGGGGVSAIFP